MIAIYFEQPDGSRQQIDADPAMTLMEAAREANVPGILAECGGGAICSTCHVHIVSEWADKFPQMQQTEDMLLDLAPGRDEYSRLSCQLQLAPEHDGLVVKVPAEQSDY